MKCIAQTAINRIPLSVLERILIYRSSSVWWALGICDWRRYMTHNSAKYRVLWKQASKQPRSTSSQALSKEKNIKINLAKLTLWSWTFAHLGYECNCNAQKTANEQRNCSGFLPAKPAATKIYFLLGIQKRRLDVDIKRKTLCWYKKEYFVLIYKKEDFVLIQNKKTLCW